MTVPERETLLAHLREQYTGVFTDAAIERHVDEYVELAPAAAQVDALLARTGGVADLLDVGCGYGAFVLAARERGVAAVGIELAPFEVAYARRRLAAERPGDDPAAVYVAGDALALPFADASFDVVTLWNVLEHVPNRAGTLREAARVLRPGGRLVAVAPNYAAFRREAHYHVPWLPLLPRRAGVAYLRALGRRPEFFRDDVFYATNRGVRRALRGLGLRLQDQRLEKLDDPASVNHLRLRRAIRLLDRVRLTYLLRLAIRAEAANPLRPVISIEARKP